MVGKVYQWYLSVILVVINGFRQWGFRKGLTVVPGGHLSVILVVIIGFRQWGVRKGQNMAQTWPRLYIYIQNFWL